MAALSRQRAQSSVEFGASAVVLLLIVAGLLDLGRSFYFDVGLRGATREGARQATWFDPGTDTNPYLYDSAIKASVDANLLQSGMPASILQNPTTTCPATADGNSHFNPPYADAAFAGATPNAPLLYICYENTPGLDLTAAPPGDSYSGQDVNVILVMRFASVTGLFPDLLGDRIRLVSNTHMTVGGYPCPAGGC